jgi:hypothetical protein
MFPMTEVHAVAIDTSGSSPRVFAAITNEHFGPTVVTSDDLGVTWDGPDRALHPAGGHRDGPLLVVRRAREDRVDHHPSATGRPLFAMRVLPEGRTSSNVRPQSVDRNNADGSMPA